MEASKAMVSKNVNTSQAVKKLWSSKALVKKLRNKGGGHEMGAMMLMVINVMHRIIIYIIIIEIATTFNFRPKLLKAKPFFTTWLFLSA